MGKTRTLRIQPAAQTLTMQLYAIITAEMLLLIADALMTIQIMGQVYLFDRMLLHVRLSID